MRMLPISLLLAVVIAIFGMGFILDTVFEKFSAEQPDSLSQITEFGQGLSYMANAAENPADIVSNWPETKGYRVRLLEMEELPLPDSLQQAFKANEPLILDSEEGLSIHYMLNAHNQVLALESSYAFGNEKNFISWIFTGIFYLGTLAIVLLWLKPLLNRLRLLRNSTQAFGAGELDSRVNTQGVTYIHDIEHNFNAMAAQIQQLIEDNKLLTSAVSHDLRTPLTRLRLGIDTYADSTSVTLRNQYFERINKDLNSMEALVDSLLEYARLDNVMLGVEKTTVSLTSLLSQCSAQFYDENLSIEISESQSNANDPLNTHGAIEHLATLFNNLIQNATKHADKSVIIEKRRSADWIEIIIRDDGPGIPTENRQRLMKPFERGDSGSGFGLGLSVASRIAQHHTGDINIEQCELLGGTKLSVRLPAS